MKRRVPLLLIPFRPCQQAGGVPAQAAAAAAALSDTTGRQPQSTRRPPLHAGTAGTPAAHQSMHPCTTCTRAVSIYTTNVPLSIQSSSSLPRSIVTSSTHTHTHTKKVAPITPTFPTHLNPKPYQPRQMVGLVAYSWSCCCSNTCAACTACGGPRIVTCRSTDPGAASCGWVCLLFVDRWRDDDDGD